MFSFQIVSQLGSSIPGSETPYNEGTTFETGALGVFSRVPPFLNPVLASQMLQQSNHSFSDDSHANVFLNRLSHNAYQPNVGINNPKNQADERVSSNCTNTSSTTSLSSLIQSSSTSNYDNSTPSIPKSNNSSSSLNGTSSVLEAHTKLLASILSRQLESTPQAFGNKDQFARTILENFRNGLRNNIKELNVSHDVFNNISTSEIKQEIPFDRPPQESSFADLLEGSPETLQDNQTGSVSNQYIYINYHGSQLLLSQYIVAR